MVAIHGRDRVRVRHRASTSTPACAATIDCDTVVTTGDWIPDHELARTGGLDLDPATRGPVVDAALRTSRPGVFAVGNLVHPVDTADGAALDGRHVASAVQAWLGGRDEPAPRPRSCPHPRRGAVEMGHTATHLGRRRRACAR